MGSKYRKSKGEALQGAVIKSPSDTTIYALALPHRNTQVEGQPIVNEFINPRMHSGAVRNQCHVDNTGLDSQINQFIEMVCSSNALGLRDNNGTETVNFHVVENQQRSSNQPEQESDVNKAGWSHKEVIEEARK